MGREDTLKPIMKQIREGVGSRLARFYQSRNEQGGEETLLHAFWIQVITCARCGYRFDAHPRFRLAWDEHADRQWVACRICSRILEGKYTATMSFQQASLTSHTESATPDAPVDPESVSGVVDSLLVQLSLSRLSCKCIQGLANRELRHKRRRPRCLSASEAR
jgi:hypothetical protein